MKIKKGDHVMVMAGKDKGATGTVIAAYPDKQKVLVQGVNMIKINKKVTNQGVRGAKEGGITTQEASIHVSNVQLVDPETTRVRRRSCVSACSAAAAGDTRASVTSSWRPLRTRCLGLGSRRATSSRRS